MHNEDMTEIESFKVLFLIQMNMALRTALHHLPLETRSKVSSINIYDMYIYPDEVLIYLRVGLTACRGAYEEMQHYINNDSDLAEIAMEICKDVG